MELAERLERIERLLVISHKDVMTVADVAIYLNISESRLRHMVSERLIPFYKRGNSVFFKKSEIEDWMLQERIPTRQELSSQASRYILTH